VDALLAHARERVSRIELDEPGGRRELAEREPEQGGLSGAVGADDAGPAGADVQVDVAQHGLAAVVGEADPHEADRGHAGLRRRGSVGKRTRLDLLRPSYGAGVAGTLRDTLARRRCQPRPSRAPQVRPPPAGHESARWLDSRRPGGVT